MIPKQIVEQVTETAKDNIVSVIGEYVQLKKKGSAYMGCCPFHNEKTPSFSVSATKGFFKCFGCGKGGSAVSFVMGIESLTFPEAIHHLGKKFGINVPEEAQSPEEEAAGRERDALFAAMEYATRHYESNLRDSEEGQAYGLTYFRHRGFRDDTIATFRLGYALNGNGLLTKATADGYKEAPLASNGLIKTSEDGRKYDYFRGRVIFPIQNSTGKVIGFGARVLDAATKGVSLKYLNSPETELYKKTDIVYGIYQARAEISRQDKCFLVEGYTDVISMHQSGITNVVASSGTALTKNQILLIKRYTSNITVLYDGDAAGIHASLRGIDMILHEGMNVRVLLLPDNDDPDSFARKHTEEEFRAYVEAHENDFIRYEAETLLAQTEKDPLKRADAVHTIVASIAEVQDGIKRELYVQECARIMGVSESAVFSALEKRMVDNATKERDQQIAKERMERMRAQQQAQQQAAPAPTAYASQQTAPQAGMQSMPPDLPPDISPNDLMMLSASGSGYGQTAQQPRTVTPTSVVRGPAVPNEVEMREVLRYMVKYTQNIIHDPDNDGAEITVGDYVLNAIDVDGLMPSDPTLAKIINEYRDAEDRTAINDNYYICLPDPDVNAFAANAISRQQLSKIHSKYTTVEEEVDQLDKFVPRAVNELRLRRVIQMAEEATNELTRLIAEGASEERLDEAMRYLNDLNIVKKELAQEMGDRSILK